MALALSVAAAPSRGETLVEPAVDPPVEAVAEAEAPPSEQAPSPASSVAPSPEPPPLDAVEVPPAFDTQDAGGFLWSFIKSMLMLGVVLALIYLVLHKGLGRLVQRTQMGRRMRVVERIALDQRRALYLVEVDGQEVLLAASDGSVTQVEVRRPSREPEENATPSTRFRVESAKGGRPPETGRAEDGESLIQAVSARARESAEG